MPAFLLLAALVATLGVLALPASAGAFVYWSNGDSIGRANLNGSGVNQSFIPDANGTCGLAVNGAHVYWTNASAFHVGRANLDGSGVSQNFIPGGLSGGCGVAVDSAHVYWADCLFGCGFGGIGRANLDGSGRNGTFIVTGGTTASGIAVDGAHVYWTGTVANQIGRANIDGSGVNQTFITGADGACGVAVDGAHLYWGNGSAIGRANLDGSGVNQSFITGASDACGVAVDDAHVFWGNRIAFVGDTIGRANLDGSSPDPSFITGAVNPRGIAVDHVDDRSLTVATAGSGSGAVAGTGIDCPGDCGEEYTHGTAVTLHATPAAGSSFTGWSGACSGTGPCALTMDADKNVTATFAAHRTLSVSTAGQGSGHIAGAGLKCRHCSHSYTDGTKVTLDAKPGEHSKFAGWSGACAGKGACELTIDADKSVSAKFKFKAPGTKITKAKVKPSKRRARFAFEKAGKASRFQCQLKRKHHEAKGFGKCTSPKTYKHLKPGQYAFRVRAVGPGGHDPKPPNRVFRITTD